MPDEQVLGEWKVVITPGGETSVETQDGARIATMHGSGTDVLRHAILIAQAPYLCRVVRVAHQAFSLLAEHEQGRSQLTALDVLPLLDAALYPIDSL